MVYKRGCAHHFELLSNAGLRAYSVTMCLWAYWAFCGPESWPINGFLVVFRPWWPSRWHIFCFLFSFLLYLFCFVFLLFFSFFPFSFFLLFFLLFFSSVCFFLMFFFCLFFSSVCFFLLFFLFSSVFFFCFFLPFSFFLLLPFSF